MNDWICEFGIITKSDGSARFINESSDAICSIYGPVEVKQSKELLDRAQIEVQIYPKSGMAGCAERLSETLIQKTLENIIRVKLHPRTAISIVVQLKHRFDLSCVFNSVCLALLDAAIPMKSTFAALTITTNDITNDTNEFCTLNLVLDSNFKYLASYSEGIWTEKNLKKALEFGKIKMNNIFHFYKTSLERKLLKIEINK